MPPPPVPTDSPPQSHRIPLTVEMDPLAGDPTPVRCTIDFGSLLSQSDGRRLVDPYTIVVTRDLDGVVARYPVQFDEMLLYGNCGWIAWLVEDPEKGGEWALEFRARGAGGELARPGPRPVVGVGEELRYGDGELHAIGVPGMDQFPIAVDWDGDGLIDIISSSHYSNTQGMPWSGVFFWRNVGSNAEPRFAPPMRLYASGADQVDASRHRLHQTPAREEAVGAGHFISQYYLRCDVFDWFGTGSQDLITASKQRGIQVWRNLGSLDGAGLPLLELALTVDLPQGLPPTPYICPRVVDWDHSGRPSVLIGAPHIRAGVDNGQIILLRYFPSSPDRPELRTITLNRSSFWTPREETGDWRDVNTFGGFRAFSFDYADIDGDGREELLVCHGRHLPWPVIEIWRNTGTADEPVMVEDGFLPWSSHYMHFGFRFVANAAFRGCLLAGRNGASGIRYFERVSDDPRDPESYRDRGLLLGEDVPLRVEGWSRPAVIESDAGTALVAGDEPGFVSTVVVRGGERKMALSSPRKLCDPRGAVIHLYRESILHDNDLDRYLGLTKPAVCDWDGDGEPDLIIGHNTNRILWLRGCDFEGARCREICEIGVEGDPNPFAWRAGPAAVDFDGDGRPELIASDSSKRICIFHQRPGRRGLVSLTPGIPLQYESGEIISAARFPPAIYEYGMVCLHACDWDGNGVCDLLVSSNYTTCLLRNVGDNGDPVFAEPQVLCTPQGPVEIGHHETAACAWDWDGDGRPDLVIGGESGAFYLFHRDVLAGIEHRVIVP